MLYDEPFGSDRALGFALIWTALLLYSAVGLRALWRERRMAGA